MDDKFIMMGLDDERAKKVAEAIGNATCKKIINYLAEIKEASEKDISDALKIPLNTVEYNLKKLIDSGLAEKTKNFFWSRKGKRIEMFKLARKHIVISPKIKRVDMNALKGILPIVIAAVVLVLVGIILLQGNHNITQNGELQHFSSTNELKDFIKENTQSRTSYYGAESMNKAVTAPSAAPAAGTGTQDASATQFSTTNIQVEGVDEPDIVKNDGKYIYAVTGNYVAILNAYPAENMNIVSKINLTSTIRDIFLNGDKLIVFSQGYENIPFRAGCSPLEGIRCGGYSEYKSFVDIYNIKDKSNPKLEQNISIDGSYIDSRMIGDYVYVISNKYVSLDNLEPPIYTVNGVKTQTAVTSIAYFPTYQDTSYVFTSIAAINTKSGDTNSEVFLTGYTGTIYVSQNNIYLTHQKTISAKEYNQKLIDDVYSELLPNDVAFNKILSSSESANEKMKEIADFVLDYSKSLTGSAKTDFDTSLMKALQNFEEEIQKEMEKTEINKISIDGSKIEYKKAGEVSGTILNQFSMDEYKDNFRIATTTGDVWSGNSLNHLYILNSNLDVIGKVEDLAHGEKIYSARFIGNRAYIVTFKKVDPLFVIDTTNPKNPKVLGYLKITGFSDYLHPYDETHIIGVGKEAVDASDAEVAGRGLDFAWYQGIKISVFDVSDVSNPVENAKIVIGDRGTDSAALYDHKAFLFNKDKNLLVIPVTLAEINRSKYRECTDTELKDYRSYQYCLTSNTYGEQVWDGAYVLNIDTKNISIRGKITHNTEVPEEQYGYKYFPYESKITRSLFMDNVLYTISSTEVKANDLNTIDEISSVKINDGTSYPYPVEIF